MRVTAGHVETVAETVHEHGVTCTKCTWGFWRMNAQAREVVGTVHTGCGGTFKEYQTDQTHRSERLVCGCGRDGERQYSFGAYAGIYCETCWPLSGYRDARTPSHLCEPCDEPLDEEPAVALY